jgi:hypothetical protein
MDQSFLSSCFPGPGAASTRKRAAALPCLYSNNCTDGCDDNDGKPVPAFNKLQGAHRKTAWVLAYEIQQLATRFGLEKLGFLTLTFADQVRDIREAQRRFHSLCTHVLKARYRRGIGVWERQRSGAVHFHLVEVLDVDIRTGFDFEAIKRRDYRSASPFLRSEWKFWREIAPVYGFGRTELLPVISTAEGIARYVGSYVKEHVEHRAIEDKGARVVRFIGFTPDTRTASNRFSWNTPGGWLWRHKLAVFCQAVGVKTTDDLRDILGPRWAYVCQSQILAMQLTEVFPDEQTAKVYSESRDEQYGQSARAEFIMRKLSPEGKDYDLRELTRCDDSESGTAFLVSRPGFGPSSWSA